MWSVHHAPGARASDAPGPDPYGESVRDQLHRAFSALDEALDGLRPEDVNRDLGPGTNSLAILVHHTIEAARSILHDLAGDSLPRDREAAFRVADATVEDLRSMLAEWDVEMDRLLDLALAADPSRLTARFREAPTAWWLLHAIGHTREHAAHAQLTRQLIDAAGPARG
jgi:hypothetical protein